MLTGRDAVLISSIDWSDVWQVPQEIALRLARSGNRVLFVENTGVRSPVLGDLSRVNSRFKGWLGARRSGGLRRIEENVYLSSPLVLPPFGPAWRRQLNRRIFIPRIGRAARRVGMRDPLLWTFLPTDSACEIVRSLRTERSVVLYYCAADFTCLTPYSRNLELSERSLLEQCDVVFATCTELERRCGRWNRNVHVCPHGVDLSAFPSEETPEPAGAAGDDLRMIRALPRPVIGFIGGLHRFVDYDLLSAMARGRPAWTWVFVGPGGSSARTLSGLPNVHLIGRRPHEDMVHYIRTFDVGIVPYVKNIRTRTILPVKINEYLAVGKAVVSTDLEPVSEFNGRHPVLMTADNRPEPFLHAIEQVLRDVGDPAEAARRRAIAAQYDWPICMERMSALIGPLLKNEPQRPRSL